MRGVYETYMGRLEDELRDLPRSRRAEIVGEIREHIDEADPVGEVEMREVLERLGDPEDIAAEARERFGITNERRMGLQEIFAVILLAIGGILFPVIGWIIGVALLWGSSAWDRRDKWVGTLVFPGGLSLPLLLLLGGFGSYECFSSGDGERMICPDEPSGLEKALAGGAVVLIVLGTIFTAIYLSRRARRGAY